VSYIIECQDGPAEGWRFLVESEPDDVIYIAPARPWSPQEGEWHKVPAGAPPEPGQRKYTRAPMPSEDAGSKLLQNEDGDTLVYYGVEPL
jgi:hypothetical protein